MNEYRSIPENPINLKKYFQIFWKRKLAIGIFSAIGLFLGLITFFNTPKIYKIETPIYKANPSLFVKYQILEEFVKPFGYKYSINESSIMEMFIHESRDQEEIINVLMNYESNQEAKNTDEARKKISTKSKSFKISSNGKDQVLSYTSQDLSLAKKQLKETINLILKNVKQDLISTLSTIHREIEQRNESRLKKINSQLASLKKYAAVQALSIGLQEEEQKLALSKGYYESIGENILSINNLINELKDLDIKGWVYYDLELSSVDSNKREQIIFFMTILGLALGMFYVSMQNIFKP